MSSYAEQAGGRNTNFYFSLEKKKTSLSSANSNSLLSLPKLVSSAVATTTEALNLDQLSLAAH